MHKLIQKYVRAVHALGALCDDAEADAQARVASLATQLRAAGASERVIAACERSPAFVIRLALNHAKMAWIRRVPSSIALDGYAAHHR